MGSSKILALSLVVVLAAACSGSPEQPNARAAINDNSQTLKTGRVLLIGLDGTRPDALQIANTPNLDALISNGAVDYQTQVDYQTFSGPGWTSMLTGVWCDKHKVDDNNFPRDNLDEYPHFFQYIEDQKPELRRASFVNWPQINRRILKNQNAETILSELTDDEVSDEGVKAMQEGDYDVVMVAYDDNDHAGHSCCFATDNDHYLEQLETTDARLGRVVDAMKARPNYEQENWLVLVTTDHGGVDSSHGQNTPEERTTFLIVSGEQAQPIGAGMSRVTDFAVTAMAHLGIEVLPEYDLDGVAVGLQGAPNMTRRESINTCYTDGDEDRAYLLTREYQSYFNLGLNSTLREALGLLGVPAPDIPLVFDPTNITIEEVANIAGVSVNELAQAVFQAAGPAFLTAHDHCSEHPEFPENDFCH